MEIISCASYYGCGSSALTDLISEFEEVNPATNYEFRFIHDIDGISDLEYHLVNCPNRHNSGHALKRFRNLSQFNAGTWFNSRYEPFFNGEYMLETNKYIDALTSFTYKGFWFYDMYDKGKWKYYWYSLLTKLYSKIPLSIFEPLKHEFQYAPTIEEEEFLHCTREYIHKLMCKLNKGGKPYILIDQILPSSNIERCKRYFSDPIKLFIFDRDPRDVYILSKYVWKKEHVAPTTDPESFSKWYKFSRDCSKRDNKEISGVMRLNFEDLVYNYDKTESEIINFIGLKETGHKNKFQKFNPKRSVHNTQLWKKYPESLEEIKSIELLLPEFLYDFEQVCDNEIKGIEPNCTNVF